METLQGVLFSILALFALIAGFYITCVFCGVAAFVLFPVGLIIAGPLFVSVVC